MLLLPLDHNVLFMLRERRRQMNLTQKDLAQRIGTSYKYISRLENGKKFPSLEMLICIAGELEVSLDYIINADQFQRSSSTEEILFNSFNKFHRSDFEKGFAYALDCKNQYLFLFSTSSSMTAISSASILFPQ